MGSSSRINYRCRFLISRRRRKLLVAVVVVVVIIFATLFLNFANLSRTLAEETEDIDLTVTAASLPSFGTGDSKDAVDIVEESGLAAMLALASTLEQSSTVVSSTSAAAVDVRRLRNVSHLPRYVPRQILVHLDLKGAPPKLRYLGQLFPLLKQMGATGLLIEYEDMFPFWGPLTTLSARNAFTYDDVKTLLAMASENELDVIPLVQTFGHMEFVLKGSKFRHLREVRSYPQAICPSRPESMLLVQTMIDQTVALHPGIRWLHIGCDEVFHLGRCRFCHRRFANSSKDYAGQPRSYLFLEHVRQVASYVKDTYGIQPIVWDDMFRSIPTEYIVKSGVHDGLIEPMIWAYSADIVTYIGSDIWTKYAKVFPNVWVAGAFKGAFGETNYVANIYGHTLNCAEWLNIMRQEESRVHHFRGLVLTGWQRYDHFSVLCELLPSSVPSLAVTLLTARNGRLEDAVLKNVSEALHCSDRVTVPTIETLGRDHHLRILASCDFPGSEAFQVIRSLQSLRTMVTKHLHKMSVEDGWLVSYVWRRSFANPYRVLSASQRTTTLLRNAGALKRNAAQALARFFESSTVNEWVEQQLDPLVSALEFADVKMQKMLQMSEWPRRPLP